MKKIYFLTLALICAIAANAASITIYAKKAGLLSSKANLYYWGTVSNAPSWPGVAGTTSNQVVAEDGQTYWKWTITATGSFNIIFNNGTSQTADITNLSISQTEYWYVVNSNKTYEQIEKPTAAPALYGSVNITANIPTDNKLILNLSSVVENANDASDVVIKYTVGTSTEEIVYSEDNKPVIADGESVTTWLEGTVKNTVCSTAKKTVYPFMLAFVNTKNWSTVNIYLWDKDGAVLSDTWPGTKMSKNGVSGAYDVYTYLMFADNADYKVKGDYVNVIFNNGSSQTSDLKSKGVLYQVFNGNGSDVTTSVEEIATENVAVEYYNLQGVKVANPENGIFIRKQGSKTTKVVL